MNKNDFKYESKEYFIDNAYVFEDKNYLLIIDKEIFDDKTIEYANEIIKKYEQEKDILLEYMLEKGLRDFYNNTYNYSDEYIKENIGRPQIRVDYKKDDKHPDWKFQYAGVIEFCESNIDEHIISVEFMDDLKLSENVQIDG